MNANVINMFGETINNLAFNNTFICLNNITEQKTVSFPQSFNFDSNISFKVLFVYGHDNGSSTYNLTLNGKSIRMNNKGNYQNLPVFNCVINGTSRYVSIQPGLVLDLYFDSTQDSFIVVGNPVVISVDEDIILADGTKIWDYNKNKISSVLGLTASQYNGNAATSSNCTGNSATATHAVSADSATSAGNADTVDGYHAREDAAGSTVVARNSSGYVFANIFNDSYGEENINNYSYPKLMFKGNGDGYIRNTDPANVTVGNSDKVDGYHAGILDGQLVPVSSHSWDGTNGYIVYGNGLIIQWGYWEGSGRDYETISLHLGYSSINSYGAYVTAVLPNSSYGNYSTIAKRSASTVELATWNTVDSHRNGIRAQWFTIGY